MTTNVNVSQVALETLYSDVITTKVSQTALEVVHCDTITVEMSQIVLEVLYIDRIFPGSGALTLTGYAPTVTRENNPWGQYMFLGM